MNKQTLTILFKLVWLLLLASVITSTIIFIYMCVIYLNGTTGSKAREVGEQLGRILLGLAVVIPVTLYWIEKLETKIKKVCYNKNIGGKK